MFSSLHGIFMFEDIWNCLTNVTMPICILYYNWYYCVCITIHIVSWLLSAFKIVVWLTALWLEFLALLSISTCLLISTCVSGQLVKLWHLYHCSLFSSFVSLSGLYCFTYWLKCNLCQTDKCKRFVLGSALWEILNILNSNGYIKLN